MGSNRGRSPLLHGHILREQPPALAGGVFTKPRLHLVRAGILPHDICKAYARFASMKFTWFILKKTLTLPYAHFPALLPEERQ